MSVIISGREIDVERDAKGFAKKIELLKKINPAYPSDTATAFPLDESGMAELFAQLYEGECRYCPEKKSWFTWADGRWVRDCEGLIVSSNARDFCRMLPVYSATISDDLKRTEWLKLSAKTGSRKFREMMLKDARDDLMISVNEFDSNPYLINCKNGTYNLQTGKFYSARPTDFLTMQTAFEFRKEWCKSERWEKFIAEVTCNDTEKAKFLQRALGYSMVGLSNEECMFILYGRTTRNGKSTLLETIQHMLGDYSAVSPVSIICKSDRAKNAEAASPTTAALKGKRFVTMAESNQYGRLDEESIKQLTGGEEIMARNLYEAPFTYLPQFSMWLSCNDLPSVTDKSLFASDRIKVITFDRHFGEGERDTGLKALFHSPETMSAIFVWLVKGYRDYAKHGLAVPECIKSAIKQYEKDNDLILQFLEERCERTHASTRIKDLYDTYKVWCKGNGYYICSAKKFASGLETHTEWYDNRRIHHGYPTLDGLQIK